MKKEFIGYYDPTEKEINNAWNKGNFAFDANTLLNLYRYTELTRKDFLGAIQTIKDKLFVPFQAAYEYQSNRRAVIEKSEKAYTDIIDTIKKNFDDKLIGYINQFKKHPSIEIDKIFKLHTEYLTKLSKELENQKKNHPDFYSKDEVLEELTELFEHCIGKEFSKEDYKKIYLEGKERYAESIPPGFKDSENKHKKGERHIYGDLIIWKELINFTKKEVKPLIFVTDDRKDDWWTLENGKTVRPREELIKEFYDLTGIRILIYNADNFLHYAKEKKLVPQLKQNTIKEVKEIRISDENTNLLLEKYARVGRIFGNLGSINTDGSISINNTFGSLSNIGSDNIYRINTAVGNLSDISTDGIFTLNNPLGTFTELNSYGLLKIDDENSIVGGINRAGIFKVSDPNDILIDYSKDRVVKSDFKNLGEIEKKNTTKKDKEQKTDNKK